MNRTRRLAALTLLVAPALAVGPALAAHAATTAAPAAAKCNVEVDSAGKYHLWGEGFPAGMKVTYSGSASGSVPTDKTGRFDVGGLSGSTYVVKTADGKTTVHCVEITH
ncbi:hypothetical protein ABZ924_16905 [Streptomyces sp. NPDC046876]|uniref:hypothetical protein n=1 Tax=Streptomyces sp. NPDC046876 TaxID=3155616 RepID=UPI0033E0F85F